MFSFTALDFVTSPFLSPLKPLGFFALCLCCTSISALSFLLALLCRFAGRAQQSAHICDTYYGDDDGSISPPTTIATIFLKPRHCSVTTSLLTPGTIIKMVSSLHLAATWDIRGEFENIEVVVFLVAIMMNSSYLLCFSRLCCLCIIFTMYRCINTVHSDTS